MHHANDSHSHPLRERRCGAQYKFANGDVYEGEYVRGRKEGKGTYKSIVGAVYKGEYKADRREGQVRSLACTHRQ
jgi:hypothetical protein